MITTANKVDQIFWNALQLSSEEERRGYLDGICNNDAELRRLVEKLLRAQPKAEAFLEQPFADPPQTVDESFADRPGMIIGPYKLMELIGEGGMGLVFVAEQEHPVRRKVALKVIKPGMDTRQVIARFEAERQALALMDHPNIAKVLDGGETVSGRPYFVMELVKGIPITEYCDQAQMTPRKRLELFLQVCHAVQHAHQKGIIHRDLKPTNVLVTLHDGVPVPKIIDFGVAKAMGQQLTDKTIYTNFAQLVGTPLYMSPEQAALSGLDMDTRSDVYSLGVLLYELLTGTTPFNRERLRTASYDEIRRIIREEEPPRPSTRISTLGKTSLQPSNAETAPLRVPTTVESRLAETIAQHRKSDPKRLRRLFRGELDWIVMKALEKDRNRRYETASAFASDVQRYLNDEPVQACPPSAAYRLRKFTRRHKISLLIASSIFLAVFLAFLGLAVSNAQIEGARRNEKTTREKLEIQLYYQTVGLADRERMAGNVGRAEELLEAPECPPNLRGWEWHYLKRLRFGEGPSVRYGCLLWSLAVSPNGRWLAVGGMDGIIHLWDVKTWTEARPFQAHESHVKALAFSPDSSRLASGSWGEGSVKIWSIPASKQIMSLPHGEGIASIAFSPDGRRLVSAGDPAIKVWDAVTWQELSGPAGGKEEVESIAFSPDGGRLAAGSLDGTVKAWDAATWRELFPPLPHRLGYVLAVAFSPDGTRIASSTGHYFYGGGECAIQIWDSASGQLIRTLRGHQGGVFSLAFSPNGKRLATTGGEDPTIKIWDTADWLEALTLRGHDDTPWGLAFSPDGHVLYSAGADHMLRVWDGTPLEDNTDPALRTFTGHTDRVAAVVFDHDDRQLVSGGLDHTIRVWDVATGKQLHSPPVQPGLIQSLSFSPEGHLLASASSGEAHDGEPTGLLKVWECRDWKELRSLRLEPEGFMCAVFAPGGQKLVAAGVDSVVVWETTSFQRSLVQYAHVAHLSSVAVSPDGRRAVAADVNGDVRIWDLESARPVLSLLSTPPLTSALVNFKAAMMARPLHPLHAHKSRVNAVAYSPKGDVFATCGMDGYTHLWDGRTFKRIAFFNGPANGVRCLAFSPDGTRLASGGNDATIRVWDVAKQRHLFTLYGHADVVHCVTFSHDGRYIASGSRDQTVKIWDARENSP
jgi:WD40 repeat protein/serine/threonine protein kinase